MGNTGNNKYNDTDHCNHYHCCYPKLCCPRHSFASHFFRHFLPPFFFTFQLIHHVLMHLDRFAKVIPTTIRAAVLLIIIFRPTVFTDYHWFVFPLFITMLSYKIVTYHLHYDCCNPRCRIGNKQKIQLSVLWKKCKNPQNTHSDSSDNRQYHWHCGISHSTQCTRKKIHNTAQKIWNCRDG